MMFTHRSVCVCVCVCVCITLQQAWQQWEKLLVQKVMATPTNRPEQCTQQQEVIVRLLRTHRQFHRPAMQAVKSLNTGVYRSVFNGLKYSAYYMYHMLEY